jgi:gliding motility-associated-like protein
VGKVHGTDLAVKQKPGAYFKATRSGDYDMFIAEFGADGAQLWTTYFGGSGREIVIAGGTSETAIAFDCSDQLYIAGNITEDPDDIFPRIPSTEPNSFYKGTYTVGNIPGRPRDAFITRFDRNGVINWSTLITSDGYDVIRDMMIRDNQLFLVGEHNWSGGLILGKPGSYQQNYTGISEGWFDDGMLQAFALAAPEPESDTVALCNFPALLEASEPGVKEYTWFDGSKASSVEVPGAGTYTVQKLTATGCTISQTFVVEVAPAPLQPLLAADSASICEDDSIMLSAALTPGAVYLWQDGSNGLEHLAQATGSYHVTATLGNCKVSDTIFVNEVPYPSVYLGPDTLICTGDRLLLNAFYNGASYLWQDGSTQATQYATGKGIYSVHVTVDPSCAASDTVVIDEDPCSLPYLPSAFSPNGDGLNDLLRIIYHGSEYKLLHFSVFNRWGEVVFNTRDFSQGWDGSYKGKPCDVGAYFYVWEVASDRTGQHHSEKGDVTLVR